MSDLPTEQSCQLSGRPAAALAALTAGAVLLFALVFIAVPDRLFADDSYFYYQVAWNLARGMGSTFNTLMPTNGYHPLWMLVCALIFKAVPAKPAAVHAIAAVISLLDALMLFEVGRLLRRYAGGLWPLGFLLLVPFTFGSQLGTEGALSGLFLTLLMATALGFVARPTGWTGGLFSLTAGLAVLSRLDNIFIVAFVSAAVFVTDEGDDQAHRRRLQMVMAMVPALLWCGYVASNWFLFGTVQPISGMLKSASQRDHTLGGNLPHTALIALAVIVPCFFVVARFRRDRFFRLVETPFALGVVCHLLYIVFVMSSETRWTWYYTSWILLGSILLSRAGSILLAQRSQLALALCTLASVALLGVWYKASYRKFYRGAETRPPANFNPDVYLRAGIHRALAYDEPGVFAYYSDIEIVPIDGLMGDLKFQHDLATTGVKEFVAREHIDGFIGPDAPIDAEGKTVLCDHIFLSSEQFHCGAEQNGHYPVTAVDIYARVPSRNAGTLRLDPAKVVWRYPGAIAVWRLDAEPATP